MLCGTLSVKALNATAAISCAEMNGIFPSPVAEMIYLHLESLVDVQLPRSFLGVVNIAIMFPKGENVPMNQVGCNIAYSTFKLFI